MTGCKLIQNEIVSIYTYIATFDFISKIYFGESVGGAGRERAL